ncbi:MAG: hypothetical protein FK734_02805 [Asgard group archaeon]|nr:hypothetical protein [Asgard group archaeon]
MKWDSKIVLLVVIILPIILLSFQTKGSIQAGYSDFDNQTMLINSDLPSTINGNYTEIHQWDDEFSYAEQVMVIDNVAFYLDEKKGLILLDITNKSDLKEIGNYKKSNINCFYVSEELIYIGGVSKWSGGANSAIGLEVLDYSNPLNITKIGQFIDIGEITALYVKNNIVYTLDYHSADLRVVDFNDLENPIIIYEFQRNMQKWFKLTSNGHYLAMISTSYDEGENECALFDISNATNPIHLNEFTIGIGDAFFDENNYLFVTHYGLVADILVYDVSLTTPILLSSIEGRWPMQIFVEDSIAYTCGINYFGIFDFSNISNPIELALVYNHNYYARDIAKANDFCLIPAGSSGLFVVNVQNTTNPELYNKYGISGSVQEMVAKNGIMYIADYEAGIKAIDFKDVFSPKVLYEYYDFSSYFEITVQDDLLIALSIDDSFVVFNIQNPSNMIKIAEYYINDPNDIILENDILYVSTREYLFTYNCSDPLNITELTSYEYPIFVNSGSITKHENQLFVICNDYKVFILNISAQFNISYVSDYYCDVSDIYIQNNLAYMVNDGSLLILDLTNISQPTLASEYHHNLEDACAIIVENNIAYIACNEDDVGLQVIDVSNIHNLKTIGNCIEGYYIDILLNEELIFLSQGSSGIALVGKDSDNDFLADISEIYLGTDQFDKDTDNDWIDDGVEVKGYGTNPLLVDTDGDRFSDSEEIYRWRTDPLDAADKPGFFDYFLYSDSQDWFITMIMYLPIIFITIVSGVIRAIKTRKAVEHLSGKTLRGIFWIKLRPAILFIFLLIQSLSLFLPITFLKSVDYLKGNLRITFMGSWTETFKDNLGEIISFSGLNSELGNFSSAIPYLLIIGVALLLFCGLLFIPQSSLIGKIDKKLGEKDIAPYWRLGGFLTATAGILGIAGMSLFTVFSNAIKSAIVSQYDSSYLYELTYKTSYFFNFVLFGIIAIIGLFTVIFPGRQQKEYQEVTDDIDELVKGAGVITTAAQANIEIPIKKKEVSTSTLYETGYHPERKIYKIDSLWNYIRNRLILFIVSLVLFCITIATVGFVCMSRFGYDTDTILLWGGIAIIGPILLLFFMQLFVRPMLSDIGSIRSARILKNINYLELAAKELTVGKMFISRPFFTYGYWRRRLAIGALCDIGTKEAINILLEIEREGANRGIKKIIVKAIGIIYYKHDLSKSFDLDQALERNIFTPLKDVKQEQIIDTSVSYWDKMFKKGRMRIAFIMSIAYTIIGFVLIITDAIVHYFYFGFGLGGLMFILGAIILILYTINYRLVKNLKDNYREDELLELVNKKGGLKKSFAIIALVDIKSEKALPIIKALAEQHLDVPTYQSMMAGAYNELLARLNREK